MPIGDEPTREPFLKRMFFGNSNHTDREEKVLEYIIHRMNKGARLHDVIQEDYVRRNCSQDEVNEIIKDPELVHASREHLWQTFRSGELDLSQGHLRSQPSADGRPEGCQRFSLTEHLIGPVNRRSSALKGCEHRGPATVERVERGYRVRCMVCEKTGPMRKTPEAARKALLVLGVQDSRLWQQRK